MAREGAKSKFSNPKPWRDEKVMVVYFPDDQKWKVIPGQKVVSRGQSILWQGYGCKKLAVNKLAADKFINQNQKSATEFTADVALNAALGPVFYEVLCDGVPAHGGSAPGIIIDG